MLHAIPHQIMLLFFPAAMAMAAASDLLTMKIPNRLSAILAIGYFAAAALSGASLAEIGMHALCGALMLAATFALFSFGWIGGGDAKLAAATALWLGWTPLADYGLVSAIAGGALTLVILFARRLKLPDFLASQSWVARLHDAKTGVPYGIALALGGLVVYPETQFWSQLALV
jgi:prepilin peptidase CpaA